MCEDEQPFVAADVLSAVELAELTDTCVKIVYFDATIAFDIVWDDYMRHGIRVIPDDEQMFVAEAVYRELDEAERAGTIPIITYFDATIALEALFDAYMRAENAKCAATAGRAETAGAAPDVRPASA